MTTTTNTTMTTGFDPDKEDLRDYLRDDRDGSRAHQLVQQLAARSKAAGAAAGGGGATGPEAAAKADRTRAIAEALMLAANVVEKLSPRLRS